MMELGQQDTEKKLEKWDKRPKLRAQNICNFNPKPPSDRMRVCSDRMALAISAVRSVEVQPIGW